MEKRDKKIDLVKKYIKQCETSSCVSYSYGGIPEKILKNACSGYGSDIFGKRILPEDVIGLIDTSLLSNGKAGILFTEDGVFYKENRGKAGYCSFETYGKTGMLPCENMGQFNKEGMKKLVSELAKVETKIDIVETFDDGIKIASETVDIVEGMATKIKDVWDSVNDCRNKINRYWNN